MLLTFDERLQDRDPEQVAAALASAYRAVGFSEQGRESGRVIMSRGSRLGNLLSFRMPRLRQVLTIRCEPHPDGGTLAHLAYDVDTAWQLVTDMDREYFAREAAAMVATLTGDPAATGAWRRHRTRSLAWSVGLVVLAGLIGLGVALVATWLAGRAPFD